MKTYSKLILVSFLITSIFSLETEAQNVGDNAPDFTLDKADSGSFTLSENKGKVVFIFLFGNNCPHCKANGPNTQTDIYKVYKDNPNFVAIGIDTWDGNSSVVQSYKSVTGIEYPLLLKGSIVQTSYKTTYDRIIIVDTMGKIQYKSTTNADKATTAAASNVLSKLLENLTSISVKESKSKQFLLAPNIVENQIIISNPFEEIQKINMRIIDLTGKLVYSQSKVDLTSKSFIDISALNPGIYTLLLNGSSDYRVAKFVKIR